MRGVDLKKLKVEDWIDYQENPKSLYQLWWEFSEAIKNGTMEWECEVIEDET